MKTVLAATTVALAACALPASAQLPPTPVVVIVKVPTPWYAPRFLVSRKMRDTVPLYSKLPGLSYKMFSLGHTEKQFGGIYFWRSRADAQAWFNPAWFERVEKDRGAKGDVRTFDALVSIDNTAAAAPPSESKKIATLVLIPTPQGVNRDLLLSEFKAAVPLYQKIPGLLRKHFIVTDDGQFGGVYLWRDKASSEQWFNSAWHERVRQTYQSEARMEWFDIPILTPSLLADNKIDIIRP